MISVIVPVYNVEEYLEKCVDSIVAQKVDEEFEVILVDDGSKDNSGQLCDELAEKYPNVKSFHKENGGLSDARNYGIKVSTGDKITFIDSDDYVEETYLKDLLDLMNRFDADMAITKVVLRYPGESSEPDKFEPFVVGPKEAFYEVYAGFNIGWSACGKLFKREILGENAFPDGFYEDSGSMYKFLERCDRVAIGDYNNNYHYVRRDGSITGSKLQKKHFRIFEVCDQVAEYIDNTYPDYKFISVMMYQNAVEQLLNRVTMTPKQYRRIFNRYKKYFRKNLLTCVRNDKINWKQKVYLGMLCSTPAAYKRFTGLLHNDKKD